MEGTSRLPEGSFPPGLTHLRHFSLHHPADLFAALQRSAPIRYCQSLVPDSLFLHQVGYLDIGGAVVVSQSGSATDFLVEHTPNLHLLAVFQGHIALETTGGATQLASNGAALMPAGLRRTSGAHSLASITLEPARLAAAAAAISGRPWRAHKALPNPDSFPLLTLQPDSARAIHRLLHSGLPSVEEVALRCGYLRVSHFSRDFKARYGISPSQVRRL